MESKECLVGAFQETSTTKINQQKYANVSTAQVDVRADKKHALSRIDVAYGMQPKHLRYNLWSNVEERPFSYSPTPPSLATWTESARPLPKVPAEEFNNTKALQTIKDNTHLFKIVTPINVDCFEELLKTHPNCPFVQSIC